MSLFKARDWWSTWAGSDEEYDSGCLCAANIDNNAVPFDKIIVGSFHGILRIYLPKPPNFKPEDLMLEVQLQQPILQLEAGHFVSGSEKLHLAILHPRKLSVYTVQVISGAVEHGNHYTLNMCFEHILERTAYNMTYGPFGGVKGKDFICVQSMDGMLSFFEQESFAFGRFLPGFLLPGPLKYIAKTDALVTCSSSRLVETYKYKTLAVATDAEKKEDLGNKKISGKKLTADWTFNMGENALDISIFEQSTADASIFVLGERAMFCLEENGALRFMKKLEYNPSCFIPFTSSDQGINTLVGTHNKSLLVYQNVTLLWAAQLPHVPVAVKIVSFQDLNGVIVTLDETGFVHCAYLGTDPSLAVTPAPESRDINYEETDQEMKELQKIIRQSTVSTDVIPKGHIKEELVMTALVPDDLDPVSRSTSIMADDQEEQYPSMTVEIRLKCQAPLPVENVTVNIYTPAPLQCNRKSIVLPVVGDRSEPASVEVAFYTTGSSLPHSLVAKVTASFLNSSDAPRIVQCEITLPLKLVCKCSAPMKNAVHKLTLDTNKPPVSLSELFPEVVNEAVIPVAALGSQYYGGPVVTILASKTSQRYRIQCDLFEGMWLLMHELVRRLEMHFKKVKDSVPFRASFVGPLPLQEYYDLIDSHFEQRLNQMKFKELLSERAQQFRVIQRRLLTRFKDKTPAPLANLDTLLEGTYRQLLALGEAEEECERQITSTANALSCGTRLLNLLIKLWTNMQDKDYQILQSTISPEISESEDQGWEEMTDSAITHLLRSCLAKTAKDHTASSGALQMSKDTTKLKKHIALFCDRLNKGGRLDLSGTTGQSSSETAMQQQKPITPLETVNETVEEDDDTDNSQNSEKSSQKPPGRLPALKSKTQALDQVLHAPQGSEAAGVIADAVAAATY